MISTPLGEALRFCRDRQRYSLRETGQFAGVDHAYVHRLETGAKESPSREVLEKLLKVLKPSPRETEIIHFVSANPTGDPALVRYAFETPSVGVDAFQIAYSVRHRGTARPEPQILIQRAQQALELISGG